MVKWNKAMDSFNNYTDYEATKKAMAQRPQLWKDCKGPQQKTKDGRACIIPFTFKGKTFQNCATKCQPWCPTDSADASNVFSRFAYMGIYAAEWRKMYTGNARGAGWGSCAPIVVGDWSTFGAQ
jgi:hypothetical protein